MGGWDWDRFNGPASGSSWSKFFGGALVPFALTVWGVRTMILRRFFMPSRWGRSTPLTGWDAIWCGVALLGLAIFFHIHSVWTVSPRLCRFAAGGKMLALLVFVGALGWVVFRNFVLAF